MMGRLPMFKFEHEEKIEKLEQQLAKANGRVEKMELMLDGLADYLSDKNKFAIEQQIEALESLNINPNNESEDRVVVIIEQRIEQLRKEQE